MRQQRQHIVAAAALAAVAAGVSCSTPLAAESLELSLVLVSPADRWDYILEKAEQTFEANHPDIDLQVNAQILPFGDRLTLLRAAAVGGTPLDIVSLDQPEVGDFANAGFTMDLTPYIERDLDGLSDWFPAYADADTFRWRLARAVGVDRCSCALVLEGSGGQGRCRSGGGYDHLGRLSRQLPEARHRPGRRRNRGLPAYRQVLDRRLDTALCVDERW